MTSHSGNRWPVHDAKARFSELLEVTLEKGPQVVTRRGVETAVLVPIEEWRRLSSSIPSLKDLLLSDDARGDMPTPLVASNVVGPREFVSRMYLLDTNIVSELRRAKPHGAVVAWLTATANDQLHISAVTLGELQAGVELTREHDPQRAASIEHWLERVAETHKVLPMDGSAFRAWARLMHHRSNDVIEDAMIAATAIVHNLVVVTRNVRDFTGLGVRTFNPFLSGRQTK